MPPYSLRPCSAEHLEHAYKAGPAVARYTGLQAVTAKGCEQRRRLPYPDLLGSALMRPIVDPTKFWEGVGNAHIHVGYGYGDACILHAYAMFHRCTILMNETRNDVTSSGDLPT